jgi:hypothetical protein
MMMILTINHLNKLLPLISDPNNLLQGLMISPRSNNPPGEQPHPLFKDPHHPLLPPAGPPLPHLQLGDPNRLPKRLQEDPHHLPHNPLGDLPNNLNNPEDLSSSNLNNPGDLPNRPNNLPKDPTPNNRQPVCPIFHFSLSENNCKAQIMQ